MATDDTSSEFLEPHKVVPQTLELAGYILSDISPSIMLVYRFPLKFGDLVLFS